jgi:hypothetical protein
VSSPPLDASAPTSASSSPNAADLAAEIARVTERVSVLERADVNYTVTKSLDEERYTFGPLYTPAEVDAHDEYVQASELQKAMWDFVRAGQRTVHKQHDMSQAIGEVVDSVVWPLPVEVELHLPGRAVRKATLPAGTAYIGVVWSPDAWPAVKGGAITGYSLGGRAMRVQSGELLPPSRR